MGQRNTDQVYASLEFKEKTTLLHSYQSRTEEVPELSEDGPIVWKWACVLRDGDFETMRFAWVFERADWLGFGPVGYLLLSLG